MFFTLLSACTVAAMQTVGAFLVIALVVTPGGDGLSADGSVPAADHALGRDRRGHKRARGLFELFPRWGDGRDYRMYADGAVPRSLRIRPASRDFGGAAQGAGGFGGDIWAG